MRIQKKAHAALCAPPGSLMDLNPRLLHGVHHLATTSPLKSTLQCEQGCRIFNSLILTAANRGAEFYSWILTIANRGAEYLTV